jgi:hypothetical protein
MDFSGIDSLINENISKVRIDIGLSFNAPISRRWLEYFDDRIVIGIEPDPENVQKIKDGTVNPFDGKAIPPMSFDRFFLIEAACDPDDVGQKEFHKVKGMDTGCSSLYKPTSSDWSFDLIKVKTVNLSDLIEFLLDRFPFIEQIKTDTQGHDLIILKSIERHLSRIAFYDLENGTSGQYQKERDEDKALGFITQKGFSLIENSHGNHRFANKRFSNINNESGVLD